MRELLKEVCWFLGSQLLSASESRARECAPVDSSKYIYIYIYISFLSLYIYIYIYVYIYIYIDTCACMYVRVRQFRKTVCPLGDTFEQNTNSDKPIEQNQPKGF